MPPVITSQPNPSRKSHPAISADPDRHTPLADKVRVQEILAMSFKSGFLTKRGKNWKSWRRRFFILSGRKLFYFKNLRPHTRSLGCVVVPGPDPSIKVACRSDLECKRTPSLRVSGKRRVMYMYGDNTQDVEDWIDVLNAVAQGSSMPEETVDDDEEEEEEQGEAVPYNECEDTVDDDEEEDDESIDGFGTWNHNDCFRNEIRSLPASQFQNEKGAKKPNAYQGPPQTPLQRSASSVDLGAHVKSSKQPTEPPDPSSYMALQLRELSQDGSDTDVSDLLAEVKRMNEAMSSSSERPCGSGENDLAALLLRMGVTPEEIQYFRSRAESEPTDSMKENNSTPPCEDNQPTSGASDTQCRSAEMNRYSEYDSATEMNDANNNTTHNTTATMIGDSRHQHYQQSRAADSKPTNRRVPISEKILERLKIYETLSHENQEVSNTVSHRPASFRRQREQSRRRSFNLKVALFESLSKEELGDLERAVRRASEATTTKTRRRHGSVWDAEG